MDKKLKILIVTDEVWNNETHGNNVLSNWFEDFDAEFAHIYCNHGQPYNKCCKKYFQVTDMMMLKSIFTKQKAGHSFQLLEYPINDSKIAEDGNKKFYSFMKSITTETVRFIRESIWLLGRYEESKLIKFITEFNPDIIFCPRYATRKMLRLEKVVYSIAKKPMIAFSGDDEYSFKQLRFSPIFWIRRILSVKDLYNMLPYYKMYYTGSKEHAQIYKNKFQVRTKVLYKSGEFKTIDIKSIDNPIRLVYAGNLYCNRWKTLLKISKALDVINKDKIKMTLDIYTKDKLTKIQEKKFNHQKGTFLKGAVKPEELKEIYRKSHIALHVEGFDLKNKLLTKVSFSTKIIDCLASSCAVMAICWNKQSGYAYLKQQKAAICVGDIKKIYNTLNKICENPHIINVYTKRAFECGVRNHTKEKIQEQIYKDILKLKK